MELLKLSYIAHGWHLEVLSKPLFSDEIEAWKYGPVIDSIYNTFRPQGIEVLSPSNSESVHLPDKTAQLLEEVYMRYGKMDSWELSALTHEKGGPWDLAIQFGGYFTIIPDALIRKHYQSKRLEAERVNAA